MKDFLDAWKITEKNFPKEGTSAEKLAFCARYAMLAPSSYNTQPWYFGIKDNTLSLYADRRYGLPVIDPDDREMTICCAAALFTLRLAIRYFGYKETTELLGTAESGDLLARIKLGDYQGAEGDENTKLLFKAITRRHMNRSAFFDREVPEEIITKLKTAVAKEGAWLHICTLPERGVISRLVAEADHIQIGSKNFRRELAGWANNRRTLSGDGMPHSGMSYADIMNNLTPTVLRRFESESKQPVNDVQLQEGAPVIAVLGSKSGGGVERLYAGQAFMRLLLTAEANGLAVSTLNQPCQVPELRLRLHDELEQQGRAHMILRFGYASSKPHLTPRRSPASFIEIDGKPLGGAAAGKAASLSGQKKGFMSSLFKPFKR